MSSDSGLFRDLPEQLVPEAPGRGMPRLRRPERHQLGWHALMIDDLVAANRILSDQGVLDAYGHVSARDRISPQHYWISRSMPPAL